MAKLVIDDVTTNARGMKCSRILNGDGSPRVGIPPCHLRVPFEPSNFNKNDASTRLNILLELTPELEAEIRQIDSELIDYLAENAERFFKKPMAREAVAASYVSCIRSNDKGYAASLKCKVETVGPKAVICWSEEGEVVEVPSAWRDYKVRPKLLLRYMYFMGSSFGPVFQLTDASLALDENRQRRCPF
jgi:hypothetical protein